MVTSPNSYMYVISVACLFSQHLALNWCIECVECVACVGHPLNNGCWDGWLSREGSYSSPTHWCWLCMKGMLLLAVTLQERYPNKTSHFYCVSLHQVNMKLHVHNSQHIYGYTDTCSFVSSINNMCSTMSCHLCCNVINLLVGNFSLHCTWPSCLWSCFNVCILDTLRIRSYLSCHNSRFCCKDWLSSLSVIFTSFLFFHLLEKQVTNLKQCIRIYL